MNRILCGAAFALYALGAMAEPYEVATEGFAATFAEHGLEALRDAAGNVFVAPGPMRAGVGIHRVGGDHWATDIGSVTGAPRTREYVGFDGLDGASVTCAFDVDAATSDLVITQEAQSPEPGVWGVQWSIGRIPLDMNILVPGYSGIKLERTSPGTVRTFDYPIGWEAQLVIVEGDGRGFYVWADDAEGQYKRLEVTRTPDGWALGLTSMNYAPFDDHTTCRSVKWRLDTYEGDWRVAARRYRAWAEEHFRPTPIAAQQPAWVKDIRCCVIMGMDTETIEALATRLDPAQTLLYIPAWRKAGYDRDYPTYDEPFDTLGPFIERAHDLGYRVMLHVNYFGCDPLNALYAQFEPYQVRSPWGGHDKEWWLWERADPVIKFAYINPAYKPWRDLFVSRMAELCAAFGVDALHLDQTLCIYNDHNGLIDGLSMIQGNVLIHKELREALPDVAISGEGLNEVTCRYEAFAQRHAFGMNHSEGTYDRASLEMAHPVSSYLVGPYTRIYGYLGCAPPTSGQLYAAWNEAYQHWGVIPTLKPDLAEIANPGGFSKQFYDEAAFWFEAKPEPDLDGPWPEDVVFPFTMTDGSRAARMADGRLVWNSREISRTVSGVSEVRAPGSIPGWQVYDAESLLGLDPARWYPYSIKPRDLEAFHVEAVPEGVVPILVAKREDMAVVCTRHADTIVADLTEAIFDATCRSEPFGGAPETVSGPLDSVDGAFFRPSGRALHAHPPWRVAGSGVARATFTIDLPDSGRLEFVADVAMESAAVQPDRTDGVTYGVSVTAGDECVQREVHNATAVPERLALDLTPFAGRQITLDLTVHPGPERSPSYDWARWYEPRIERDYEVQGEMVIVGGEWTLALSGDQPAEIRRDGARYTVSAMFPGAVYLMAEVPAAVVLPLDVASASFATTFVSDTGMVLDRPPHACARREKSAVEGIERDGLFAHPPDHGRTVIDLPMALPIEAAQFEAYVGIRDGAKSEGVIFRVEANGVELANEEVAPGAWHRFECDLSPWADRPVVLSLITDADGSYTCDWAEWGEPVVRPK
ncbi:MAG TPA: DUF6259 domain-containing protein [Candidatus Hydrogenedentes bacterium]|nr:DUF6259 domain-containing protein [Candidatus Hydrogenedentota bacterium]HPG65498.1 DUF6259 domain-containing protein [Candidatus Hydrogenedentota bacterium]